MGASCVGKSKTDPKKSDNKSNTVSSSEIHSNEEVIHAHSKQTKLPVFILSSYQPRAYPMQRHFKVYRDHLRLHKQYRYQQILEFRKDKFVSSCTISDFSERKQQEGVGEVGWSQCSVLDRHLYQKQSIVVINGNTYIRKECQQQRKQNQNKNQLGIQHEIQLKIPAAEVYPKQLLFVSIEGREEMKINYKLLEIVQKQDVQVIAGEILQAHPVYQYFGTPFLNGAVFTQRGKENQQLIPCFLTELLGLNKQFTQSSILLLYTNKSTAVLQSIPKISLSKYFQIQNLVEQIYGNVQHCKIRELEQIVERNPLNAYLAIQFLKSIIDSLERHYLVSGKYTERKEELSQRRAKIIHQFLTLQKGVVQSLIFLANIFFHFQGIKDTEEVNDRVKQILLGVAYQIGTICDGLFHQFGYQVNEKEHFFKLEGYSFIKCKRKTIRHLNKNPQYPSTKIVNRMKASLAEICEKRESLRGQLVQIVRCSFLQKVQENREMENRINLLFVKDFLLRLQLLQLYLLLIEGKVVDHQWKHIQDFINSIEYVSPQAMLFYFTIGGLMSTALKLNLQRTQSEEFFYIKALELAHKIFGDPRVNRSHISVEKEQAWQILILQNYSGLFKGAQEKKEFYYINNINECLREDLKNVIPSVDFTQEQSPQKRLMRMVQYLPIKTISGVFYRRCLLFDSENEDVRSNYSESISSSSSSKRANKASYKINQSQFSYKLSLHSGIIRWGHNIGGPPHIFPPLKNKQVISISSGNYHTVFLTESGIFGWGQNYSSQLGSHNTEKIYLKEIICIKAIRINRNKDRYQISCGNEHTAVLINGSLFMWGQSSGGILGGNGHVFDYVVCGGLHTLAIRDGIVYSWGRGQGGQLGHPLAMLSQKKKEQTTEYFIDIPTPIKSIPQKVVKIACGDAHSLVLTTEGKVYVFGFCYQGQLGLGVTGQNENFQIFQPVEQNFFKERVVDLYAGPTFSFFKTERQEVYSCGINDCLQLGIDRVLKVFQKKKFLNRTVQMNRKKLGEQQFSKPRKIDMFNNKFNLNLMHIECGQNHCLGLVRYNGQETMLMGWGLNKNYQIDPQMNETTTPRTIDSFYSLQISQICCGSTFSLANIGKLVMTDEQFTQFIEDLQFETKRN